MTTFAQIEGSVTIGINLRIPFTETELGSCSPEQLVNVLDDRVKAAVFDDAARSMDISKMTMRFYREIDGQ